MHPPDEVGHPGFTRQLIVEKEQRRQDHGRRRDDGEDEPDGHAAHPAQRVTSRALPILHAHPERGRGDEDHHEGRPECALREQPLAREGVDQAECNRPDGIGPGEREHCWRLSPADCRRTAGTPRER